MPRDWPSDNGEASWPTHGERPDFACYDEPSGSGPTTMDRGGLRQVQPDAEVSHLSSPYGVSEMEKIMVHTRALRDGERFLRATNRVAPEPPIGWRQADASVWLRPTDPIVERIVAQFAFARRRRFVAVALDMDDVRDLLLAAGIELLEGRV